MLISDYITAEVRLGMLGFIGQEYSGLGKKGIERKFLLDKLGIVSSDKGTNDLWRQWLLSEVSNPNSAEGTLSMLRRFLLEQLGGEYSSYSTGQLMRGYFTDDPVQQLIKSADFYLSPDKAGGTSQGVNSPFTNPLVDLKGDADCTLVNFAETSASGYVTETINGKTNTFLNLDGTDDYGIFADNDVLNPVGDDDFAQLIVFKQGRLSNDDYFGIVRNENSSGTNQYALLTNGSLGYAFFINKTRYDVALQQSSDLVYVLYGRFSNNFIAIKNGVEILSSSYSLNISTEPNTQLGCRSASADGTETSALAKGLQGDIAFWKGPNGTLDKDKIVDTVKKAMKYKYGLGV